MQESETRYQVHRAGVRGAATHPSNLVDLSLVRRFSRNMPPAWEAEGLSLPGPLTGHTSQNLLTNALKKMRFYASETYS